MKGRVLQGQLDLINFGLATHIFSCFFMTGVIWLVQILVYPNFLLIPLNQFRAIHDFHTQRITWIVAPAMMVELASGIYLAWMMQTNLLIGNLLLIFVTWAFTGLVSVPLHNNLDSQKKIRRLIFTNWPRTAVWTARSIGWIFFLTSGSTV